MTAIPGVAMTLDPHGRPVHNTATVTVLGPSSGDPNCLDIAFRVAGGGPARQWRLPRELLDHGCDRPAGVSHVFVLPVPTPTARFVEIVIEASGCDHAIAFRVTRAALRAALDAVRSAA